MMRDTSLFSLTEIPENKIGFTAWMQARRAGDYRFYEADLVHGNMRATLTFFVTKEYEQEVPDWRNRLRDAMEKWIQ